MDQRRFDACGADLAGGGGGHLAYAPIYVHETGAQAVGAGPIGRNEDQRRHRVAPCVGVGIARARGQAHIGIRRFLPNLLRLLANAPATLEAYLTLDQINAEASLTLAEREVVQLTAAATHGCGFCVAGHTGIALNEAKHDGAEVEALRVLGLLGLFGLWSPAPGVRQKRIFVSAPS